MYAFVVFLHVLGAFAFVALHGVSMVTSFRLRGERDRVRQAQLLELSGLAVGLMYIGLLVLLVAGILAGFMGDHWGRAWIWVSLGTLVVIIAVMYTVASPFYGRMRAAAGLPASAETAAKFKPPASEADLDGLATSNTPIVLSTIGGVGLTAIIWLMVVKPF
jgi:MFS family permease